MTALMGGDSSRQAGRAAVGKWNGAEQADTLRLPVLPFVTEKGIERDHRAPSTEQDSARTWFVVHYCWKSSDG